MTTGIAEAGVGPKAGWGAGHLAAGDRLALAVLDLDATFFFLQPCGENGVFINEKSFVRDGGLVGGRLSESKRLPTLNDRPFPYLANHSLLLSTEPVILPKQKKKSALHSTITTWAATASQS